MADKKAKKEFVIDQKRAHRLYPVADFKKGNIKTTIKALWYFDKTGVCEIRTIETLDKDGKIVDTKHESQHHPKARVNTETTNGALVHKIVGG